MVKVFLTFWNYKIYIVHPSMIIPRGVTEVEELRPPLGLQLNRNEHTCTCIQLIYPWYATLMMQQYIIAEFGE